jgi:hypothetical protein
VEHNELTKAALEYVANLGNGMPTEEIVEHMPTDPEARELVRDLIGISTFRRVTRNTKQIRLVSWGVALVIPVATFGAAHAANLDLGSMVMTGLIAGGVGLIFAAVGRFVAS